MTNNKQDSILTDFLNFLCQIGIYHHYKTDNNDQTFCCFCNRPLDPGDLGGL